MTFLVSFKTVLGHFAESTSKNQEMLVRIARIQVEAWNQTLPNTWPNFTEGSRLVGLRSSEMLRGVNWWLVTEVSRQTIGFFFKGFGLLNPWKWDLYFTPQH